MYQQTQAYLVQLSALLKKHQLWQNEPIAVEALQSNVPFVTTPWHLNNGYSLYLLKKLSN